MRGSIESSDSNSGDFFDVDTQSQVFALTLNGEDAYTITGIYLYIYIYIYIFLTSKFEFKEISYTEKELKEL